MSALKTDGTFTTVGVNGSPRFSTPIDGDTATTQFDQDYLIAYTSYSPLALGTAHATYTTHYLIKESALEDLGGGIAKFTRTYCKVPANRSEYESFAYNFIGFWQPPSIFGAGAIGRDRFTRTVLSRMDYTYALTTPPSIISAQQYFLLGSPTLKLDYLFYAANVNDSADANGALTVEGYLTLISTTHTDITTQGIVAEDSRVNRWAGTIYERVTRYILPQ